MDLPCINNITRVTNLSGSCIGHIFIKNININQVNSYNILRCDITDHYATILMLSDLYINENIPSYTIKCNRINTNHLELLIKTKNWNSYLDYDNVDIMIKAFNSKLKEFINYSSYSILSTNIKTCLKSKNGLLLVL